MMGETLKGACGDMMKTWTTELQTRRTTYQAAVTVMQNGVVVVVGGGLTHVGTVILAEPRESLRGDGSWSATSSVINPLGHLDERPLRREAEKLAAKLRLRVAVAGGIHLDEISSEDIDGVMEDCGLLFSRIVLQIDQNQG